MMKKRIGLANKTTAIRLLSLLCICLFAACSNEEMLDYRQTEDHGMHSCKVNMNVSCIGYSDEKDSRAAIAWSEGDCIYLTMYNDTIGKELPQVQGRVVYKDNEWTLYYEGILPEGYYTGRAYFIRGVEQEEQSNLHLTSSSAVYMDGEIQCARSGIVEISAALRPQTGRIRFQGQAGTSFNLSGVRYYSAYSIPDATLTESEQAIPLTVGEDGFTPHCYCFFPQLSRTLSVAYDNYLFTTVCDHPILDAGQAGYMELPTADRHNGWTMTIISLPTLGNVETISAGTHSATLSAAIVSDGNANISDCGLCYSTSANPSLEDMHVSHGVPSGSEFTMTISGLTDNTSYHVRAYAINQLGVAYSEDFQFTTVAIVPPSLSSVTINSQEDGIATFKAVVTSAGNGTISESGFVYSTTEMPTLANSKLVSSDKESLTATTEKLTIGTRYYVRAYATNEKGTSYGKQASFIAGGGRPDDDDLNRPVL